MSETLEICVTVYRLENFKCIDMGITLLIAYLKQQLSSH